MRYDFTRNNGTVKKRIICFVMGMILLFASIVPAGFNIFAKEAETYRHMSFELHPDEDDLDKTVSLDGLMPKNASAEVIDVTDDYLDDEYPEATPGDSSRETAEAVNLKSGSLDINTVNIAKAVTASAGDADTAETDAADEEKTVAENDIYDDNNSGEDEAAAEYIAATPNDAAGEAASEETSGIDAGDDATAGDADREEEQEVTHKYVTLAAYDITIRAGKKEYQPNEKRPIRVEITDSRIASDKTILLYHIKDNGETEQITDITVEDGKVSFDATGFSVYKIVEDAFGNTDSVKFVDEISELDGKSFYISTSKNLSSCNYLRNAVSNNKMLLTDNKENAGLFYFEKVAGTEDQFYIYYLSGTTRYYVYLFGADNSSIGFSTTNKTEMYVKKSLNRVNLFTIHALTGRTSDNKYSYFEKEGNTAVKANRRFSQADVVGTSNSVSNEQEEKIQFTFIYDVTGSTNQNGLDGKTYGLMNYDGGTHGYALMADSDVHALVEIVTRKTGSSTGDTLYVDEGSEVSRWTFHIQANGKYKLSAETENGTKYLTANGDSLTLADTAEGASEFEVIPGSNNKLQLKTGGKYVTFTSTDVGGNTVNSFELSATASTNSQLNLIDFATLTDSDLITYSADRISVSDAINGEKVIVYTRIWNEGKKKYDIYAIDFNGTLYPCYASGGKILWLGDGTCSLEWEFTEYYDPVTKEPSYYYELYNPYSEKYIAPQITGDQILSESAIGINMPGRRNGEFYSEIISWDDDQYAYISMKPNADNSRLVPCSQSTSVPFYFARLEDLNLNDKLHEVETVDNNLHGITMKMQDFYDRDQMSNFLGSNKGGLTVDTVPNLLSTKLGDDGYPVVMSGDQQGNSLAGLYNAPVTVNHLFIQSVYESSGYFEFDSCQNTATLVRKDGTIGNKFTVYRELATDENGSITHKHGQFFPYNTIVEGVYSTNNPMNLYDPLQKELSEDDPRKYEKLYRLQSPNNVPNCYNGMELEASFIQTVSGLDAWGHDIIFEFTGDDDFWLYVDGELVIDLGGIHSALAGNVNFRTGMVHVNGKDKTLKQVFIDNFTTRYKADNGGASPSEDEIKTFLLKYFEPKEGAAYGCEDIFADYSAHTMRIFYMERGAGASNLHMRFNIASVTPGHVVVSKGLSGSGAASIDTDFVEYPFQIYYTLPEGENGEPGQEQLLGNDDQHVRVFYQNSNQPVTFVQKYRPPGFNESEAYENIYLINPTKNAEIAFPDQTISYRIVECAVDSTVYGTVRINGEEVPSERIEIRGNLKSYKSDLVTAENRPTIAFDNFVNDNVIKDLYITKKLVDEDGNEVTDDPATFSFRLYLSSLYVNPDDMELVNMYKYYVLVQEGSIKYLCRFNPATKKFEKTSLLYNQENIEALKNGTVSGISIDDVCFKTSGFGAISGIPSGYTICVPGLPVGAMFKVTEDVKPGYGLLGYQRIDGEKIVSGVSMGVPSYLRVQGYDDNVGRVIVDENPQVEVQNRKGYGFTVNKKWSDLSLTTSHDPIFVAVYADGELINDSVRKLVSPSTSTYYFWTSLKDNPDGSPRINFDGYEAKEVKLTGSYTVSADGKVTGFESVTPIAAGDSIHLSAVRTDAATPSGETNDKEFDYIVSYEQGEDNGSSRTDTITNTREGGIGLRLFKWKSDTPLKNGKFTLKDDSGATIGTFTSDSEGLISLIYDFEYDKMYTLTQNTAPDGYVGLRKTVKFKVNTDDTISLYYDDGTTAWGSTTAADADWADWKTGSRGINAFVDIYNKPFNFKIAKMDSANADIKLGSAHFALYKQANTTISGPVKNKEPLTGFEDMVTVNGEVDICGGNSGRVIKPGEKGSVFFLTETIAPPNYTKLSEDIVFRISPLGEPSIISNSYVGNLVETDDSFIYTLDVPNTKSDSSKFFLTITKIVEGNQGNKYHEFTFTFDIEGDDGTTSYNWTKNGETQTPIHSGGIFKMKHNDSVMIELPKNVKVTVTEDNEDYKASFKLGNAAAELTNMKQFNFTTDTNLTVTNTREGIIPTGIESHILVLTGIFVLLLAAVLLLLRGRFRRYTDE